MPKISDISDRTLREKIENTASLYRSIDAKSDFPADRFSIVAAGEIASSKASIKEKK